MALPAAYLTEVRKRNPRLVAWVEIEGLEWGFSSDDCPAAFSSRWSSGAGSTTGPKGVKPNMLALPTPVELSIDPLETVANIGQTIVRVHDHDSLLLRAVSVHRRDKELFLAAELSSSATSCTYVGSADTADYPTDGGTLYIDAETITYTGHDTGTKTFSGLTRGMYGSAATKHLERRPITPYPRFLKTRKLTWYMSRHPDLTSSSDDVIRFRGVVADYEQSEDATAFTITAEHDLRRLDWEMFSWQVTGTIDGFWTPGGTNAPGAEVTLQLNDATREQLDLVEQDRDGPGSKWVNGVGYRFDNGKCLALQDEDGLIFLCEQVNATRPGIQLIMQGPVPRASGLARRDMLDPQAITGARVSPHGKAFKEIWDVGAIYAAMNRTTVAPSFPSRDGNIGFATRQVQHYDSFHPMRMALAHLLSDGTQDLNNSAYKWFGSDGSGGGLNDGWAGLTTDEVDVAAFEALRDKELTGAVVLTWIDEPISIRDFIVRECLRPFGLYLVITDDSKLSLKRITVPVGVDTSGYVTFDESSILSDPKPRWMGNARSSFSGLRIRNSAIDQTVFTAIWQDPIFYYGRRGDFIELETTNRDFMVGSESSYALAGLYKLRFEYPGPLVALSTDYSKHETAVGDIIKLTCQHLPDTARGAMGLTNRLAHVVSKRPDDMEGRIDWVLELTSDDRHRYCKIAPTMEVVSVSGSVVTVQQNAFSSSPDRDSDFFAADYEVRAVSPDFATTRVSTGIASISGNDVTLNSVTNIVAGDYIVLSNYATSIASPESALDYAFMADSNGDLDPGAETENDRVLYRYVE